MTVPYKLRYRLSAIFLSVLILASCSKSTVENESNNNKNNPTEIAPQGTKLDNTDKNDKPKDLEFKLLSEAELQSIKPNETGNMMVVMFHNFLEKFTPTKGDKGEYTTTINEFTKLLEKLYQSDYRLISLNDFIDGTIKVPAGKIPMLFTFDDGTSGQFNLIEENGSFKLNPRTAVGVLEEFNKKHPDFGEKGVFYVNLDDNTFGTKGTVPQRLKFLLDKGYDIENHTLSHISLKSAKDAKVIQKELGGNQKKMRSYIPGHTFKSLSLPFGEHATKDLETFVRTGEYEGEKYEHIALMEVGSGYTLAPFTKKRNLLSVSRVRAPGMTPVNSDLEWWLESTNLSRDRQYISDGNPNIITVPKGKEVLLEPDKLKDKKIVTY